jgi:hypothetical protein
MADDSESDVDARSAESLGPQAGAWVSEGLRVSVPVARVVGAYGALVAALLFARGHINQLLALVQRVSPMPAMRMDILGWRTQPLTQFRSYALVLVVVAVVALVHALVLRLAERWPVAVVALETVVLGMAASMAFAASPFVGRVFLATLVPGSALLAPFVLAGRSPERRIASATPFAVVTLLQSVPLAWGVWSTTFDDRLGYVVGGMLAAAAFSLWRATARAREDHEAIAGLAFVPLPLVGLIREPRPTWVVASVVAYAAIRLALRRSARLADYVRRRPTSAMDLTVVATAWSIAAIFTTPYRFRDIPRLNNMLHEAGSYGWSNSIVHGKLMMADAGLLYGPLRSYALVLYMAFAGMTAEQVRLGQAFFTLGSLGILIALGWRFVDRHGVAMGWYVYLLLVGTFALNWMNYHDIIAFGWADLGRIAIPLFAAVGGIASFVTRTRNGELDRRGKLALAGWGAAAFAATLWAQEFGVCTLAVLLSVPFVHLLFARGSLSARARLAGATLASYGAGLAAAAGLFLGFYALHGRAGLFLSTVNEQTAAFASGSYGALQIPVDESTFLVQARLFDNAPHEGFVLEYVLAPAVYAFALAALTLRAVARRWSDGDTLTFAVLLFGMASFRFALGRTDITHLVTVTAPAVILTVRFVVEGVRARYASRAGTAALRSVVAGTAVVMAFASLHLTGVTMALRPRLVGILNGTERPSSGAPYSYPLVPRAGDVKIEPQTIAIVEAIRANSSPTDKLFQHVAYMDGGEIYFLADRVNPTRFDVLAEYLTLDRQREGFERISHDPPKLAVGEDWGMTGDDLNAFLKGHYHSIGTFGGFQLMVLND